jgi:hypothetical protein
LPYIATKYPYNGIAYRLTLNKYHNELGGKFGLAVDFTVVIVVLLDPVHRGDGYGDTLISFGIIIVSHNQLIRLVDDLPRLLLIDLHIRLLIYPLHRQNQHLIKLPLYDLSHFL